MILNKTTLERLPSPAEGYQIHWDEKLAGFGVRHAQRLEAKDAQGL